MADPFAKADQQIDALISSRAKANIEAARDRAREQERQERIRRENLAAWREYHQRLADTHAALEAENRRKARELAKPGSAR